MKANFTIHSAEFDFEKNIGEAKRENLNSCQNLEGL